MFRSMNQQGIEHYENTPVSEARIHVRNGNLYLNASLYERYFPALHSVMLMKRDYTLFILPVMNAGAGGLLLKIRNAQGDRVIHAQEFFRVHGLDEQFDQMLSVSWDEESASLVVQMPPSVYLGDKGLSGIEASPGDDDVAE